MWRMDIHLALQGMGPGGWVSRFYRVKLENGSRGQAGGSNMKQLGKGVDRCGGARL